MQPLDILLVGEEDAMRTATVVGSARDDALAGRGAEHGGVLPDRITIYRKAICAICRSDAEVIDQVRRTVIHEVGHHLASATHDYTNSDGEPCLGLRPRPSGVDVAPCGVEFVGEHSRPSGNTRPRLAEDSLFGIALGPSECCPVSP
ncbi:metallopeptidase family protein [Rhodococcus opacus]|uniref:metallopeptidase family protein n=1 Tax=Rhodococcus opacus TaxID=37919 RepID=UPI00295405DB|nr:metallopeptidase family protein [Rhodococcus opacus]MDV7088305.1 metallopeptidase family protein [Rhodococcus opacus]